MGELRRLSWRDRVSIAILSFFMLMAWTIELYFILHHHDIRQRSDVFALAYRLYGRGDAAYYGSGFTALPLALETFDVFVTQVFNALLVWAIVRRRFYRYPLQLGLSAYSAALVLLYFWTAHVSGYAGMADKGFWNFVILVVPNLPWLLGDLFLLHQAVIPVLRRFAGPVQPLMEDTRLPAA
ncbi:hypothetical protein GCM10009850_075490 [Nonomuraea monospora]|uniref:EXPERA domain-containing protein n=1 Tax=Nonomuraea monospora TaxID=568818 RepID=A0ABN3CRK3_9ACTN